MKAWAKIAGWVVFGALVAAAVLVIIWAIASSRKQEPPLVVDLPLVVEQPPVVEPPINEPEPVVEPPIIEPEPVVEPPIIEPEPEPAPAPAPWPTLSHMFMSAQNVPLPSTGYPLSFSRIISQSGNKIMPYGNYVQVLPGRYKVTASLQHIDDPSNGKPAVAISVFVNDTKVGAPQVPHANSYLNMTASSDEAVAIVAVAEPANISVRTAGIIGSMVATEQWFLVEEMLP